MSYLKEFGACLPSRVVSNAEMAEHLGCTPDWIWNVSGIEERRYAAPDETLVDLAEGAARQCLDRAGMAADDLGLVIVATGSWGRPFPGPACQLTARLGLSETPAIDLPMASAGSLFALATAMRLAPVYRNILVVGAEKMSAVVTRPPMERGVAGLFGDGAGACLVTEDPGPARLVDAGVFSDGAFSEDLKLEYGEPLAMNGRSVILQASRKIPRSIAALLERNGRTPQQVDTFLMHQANQNLIDRVAQSLGVDSSRFYTNIRRYGNTSSASMLIAAEEWLRSAGGWPAGKPVCFAAFGAGFHWGAVLAECD